MLKLTGGEALMRAISAERIPFVFGVVGGKLGPFLLAVANHPNVQFVGTRHEGHAAMMASAISAAADQLGVVVGECGSGGGNLLPGITIANANNLPMLVITSNNQHAASYPGRGMFAEMDTEAVFRPVTKWNSAIHDGRRIPELAHRALREAFTGRRGPTHLDIPQDVMRATFDYDERAFATDRTAYRVLAGPAPLPAHVAQAVALLLGAERPLLIAGGGVTASGGMSAFRAAVTTLNAAAAATQNGNGNIASDDPRFIGLGWVLGGDAVLRACKEADVVLAVGCRFSSWLWGEDGRPLTKGAKLIQIDIDPGVIGKSQSVDVGLCADATLTLEAIAAALSDALTSPPVRPWVQSLTQTYREYRSSQAGLAADRGQIMHPAALAQAIGACLPSDALVTFDGGHTTFWGNEFTPVSLPRTRFNEPGMSQLGFGLPWAIALQLLHPGSPVFNITGDGAFGFSLQELDTARRMNLPVISIIHNNASWGIIKQGYKKAGFEFGDGRDYGTALAGTDYAAIARGFGCYGESVLNPDEVKPAIERALLSKLPVVLDCRVRFEPHPGMPYFARMSSAGAG